MIHVIENTPDWRTRFVDALNNGLVVDGDTIQTHDADIHGLVCRALARMRPDLRVTVIGPTSPGPAPEGTR